MHESLLALSLATIVHIERNSPSWVGHSIIRRLNRQYARVLACRVKSPVLNIQLEAIPLKLFRITIPTMFVYL